MKFRIFFDSNQVFNRNGPLDEPFDMTIPGLHSFLKDHSRLETVSICLSDIVVKERIQHKLEQIEHTLATANEKISELQKIGHSVGMISDLGFEKYKEILAKNADTFIAKYKVEKISNNEIDIENLVEKAISKIKPFNDKGAGLKDSLIFLSMLEDARSQSDAVTYILCTQNKTQFDESVEQQFFEKTGKKLYIVENQAAIQVKLDELIPLNLHLEERNKKIQEFVLRKLGSLNKRVNELVLDSFIPGTYSQVSVSGWVGFQQSVKIVGYDYKDIKFINFEGGQTPGMYKVSVKFFTTPIQDGNQEVSQPLGFGSNVVSDVFTSFATPPSESAVFIGQPQITRSWGGRAPLASPATKVFDLELLCDFKNDILTVLSLY